MADYDEDFTPNSKVSKINAAALINLIIAKLWEDSYRHSRSGEFQKWNADLNCLWMELAGDVKPKGQEEKDFNQIELDLANLGGLVKKKEGFKNTSEDELTKNAKQYLLLRKKAVFLKRLQNNQGKGTAYQDDADDYMD